MGQSRTKRLRRSFGRGTPEGPPAFLLDCSADVLNEGIFAADAAMVRSIERGVKLSS